MMGAMFTSLKVVSMAVSDFAWTRRSAILRRRGDIRFLVVRPSRLGISTAAAFSATGAVTVLTAEGATATMGVCPSSAASISPLVTRPALPVPGMLLGFKPVSAAILRTAGDASKFSVLTRGALAILGAAADSTFGATGCAAGVDAVAGAGELVEDPGAMVATTCPTVTSVSAGTVMVI